MPRVLNVALVGAGFGGRMHLQALQRNRWVRIAAIFDIDRSRSEALATEFGVEQVPQSWSELLTGDVDCVAIVVPPPLHERMSIEALSAGKHVVCEKPLAVDTKACRRLIAAAKEAGRRLFPVHNRVYMPSVETIGRVIRDGLIGQPYLVESHGIEGPDLLDQIPWLRTDPFAGVLRSQAVHPVYVLRWLFGDVARVNAVIADRQAQGVQSDETALVTLRFASGLLAHMTATFGLGRGPSDHTFTVYGSQGYSIARGVAKGVVALSVSLPY
ncbi:MAG: Gfo/Idh/MocA family protein [Mycobacteriales bacterium]